MLTVTAVTFFSVVIFGNSLSLSLAIGFCVEGLLRGKHWMALRSLAARARASSNTIHALGKSARRPYTFGHSGHPGAPAACLPKTASAIAALDTPQPSGNRTMTSSASFHTSAVPFSGDTGSIHVIVGPMFSGKTTELLRRMRRCCSAPAPCPLPLAPYPLPPAKQYYASCMLWMVTVGAA